jgi:phasin family protein
MAPPDFTKSDFTKLFDIKALLDIQRKNIEALSEANKLAFEGFQAAGQRQAEILSQILADTSSIVKEIAAENTPEEKITRQAELVKYAYDKSVTNWREMAEIIGQSGKDATDIINDRVNSSLTELKSALKKRDSRGRNGKAFTLSYTPS